jgi:phthiodiolone/phenolphthiodiolone dimycocerosates ketoreductase
MIMTQHGISVGMVVPARPPLSQVRQLVLLARLFRLKTIIFPDHLQEWAPQATWTEENTWLATRNASPHESYDANTLMGYIASRAGNLQIGVGVTEPIRRHPALIAQSMITLAHMTKRRPILGIGAGERLNTEPYGMPFSNLASRLDEALQIIRLLFSTTGPVDFDGRFFKLDQAILDLTVPEDRLPRIWVAAHGPRMLQLTGKYGDGWYPTLRFSPDEYRSRLDTIQTAAREASRDPSAIVAALQANAVIAPTEEEARAMLDTRAVRFATLLGTTSDVWKQHGLMHPFGEEFRGFADFLPEQYSVAEIEDATAAVPTELTTEHLIWGTPEKIAGDVRALGDAGLQHLVILPVSAAISRKSALYSLWATNRLRRLLSHRR